MVDDDAAVTVHSDTKWRVHAPLTLVEKEMQVLSNVHLTAHSSVLIDVTLSN
jgi:hypothetical protein